MKSNGSACPLDQLSIIPFKRCAYLRSYLTAIINEVWISGKIPDVWKKAVTILIHKKDSTDEPGNFRPITLQSVPLKIFTSALRNRIYEFLLKNEYIENSVQKGFTPGVSGSFEHTAQLALLIRQAKKQQQPLTVTLLDLKNAFGEVHHNLIATVLRYHKIPDQVIDCIGDLYSKFHSTVVTQTYRTPFITISRGVLQGDCLSPLIFNMVINTFIQYIKSDKFTQLGYSTSKLLKPKHWFQFADDAAITTGQEYESQILLNAFTAWCTWSRMSIRVDKCKTFGVSKVNSTSVQTYPKLYVNQQMLPTVQCNESFTYLGRYFNYAMDNAEHKCWLISETQRILEKIDQLPLHPRFKLELYGKYLMSKISWHLTIADINKTWVKEALDMMCHNKFRNWLKIPANGTLDILFQAKSKFGLNIVDISTKHAQCQVILRKKLRSSKCCDIQSMYYDTRTNTNIQYDRYSSTKEVLKEIREDKVHKILTNFTSQSLVIRSMWEEAFADNVKHWQSAIDKLPKNIYNFTTRYLNNTLPTLKNMVLWKKATNSLCNACLNPQTLQHVISSCSAHLEEGRFTWRHNSILKILAEYLLSIKKDYLVYADIEGFDNPSVVTGPDDRPDMIVLNNSKDKVCVVELTIGFETNVTKNCRRKTARYKDLCDSLKKRYSEVTYFNLSMGAIGIIGKECKDFYGFLDKNMGLELSQKNYIVKKIISCCIRASYYLFCMKDKQWNTPELLCW